jgi:hypothetical protein
MDWHTSVRRTSSPSLQPGVPKNSDGMEVRRTDKVDQYLIKAFTRASLQTYSPHTADLSCTSRTSNGNLYSCVKTGDESYSSIANSGVQR